MHTAEADLAWAQNLISNVKLPLLPSYRALTYPAIEITPINFRVDIVNAVCSTQIWYKPGKESLMQNEVCLIWSHPASGVSYLCYDPGSLKQCKQKKLNPI